MRNPFDSVKPRRSLGKWCGVLLGAALALGGVSAAISRGDLARFTLFPDSQVLPARNPRLQAKRDRSLSKALAKLDAKTIRAYFERYSNPEKIAASGALPAVYIDAETLAHRHPAWGLAQRLESGAISPSDPQIARVLISARPQNSFSASLGAVTDAPGLDAPGLSAPREAPGVVLSDSSSPNTSEAPQHAALSRFLNQNAARDAARARDEALLSRGALEDETARAARVAVAQPEVPLLPPDVALELLNLRLELLRNLSRTPAARAAARERIRAIEARYADILQAQNQAQADRLRAATVEAPERARREGLLQIERDRQSNLQSGAATRREVARQAQTQLDRDSAFNGALRLQLPPFRALKVGKSRSAGTAPRENDAAPQVFETAGGGAASKARWPVEGPRLGARQSGVRQSGIRQPGVRQPLIRELRQQARLQGEVWARECAAVLGATWSRNPQAPDATARALKLVFPRGAD